MTRRLHVFAARFLDFAVLTDEHLVFCSTGFFTRRPRRRVFREPLSRLVVDPARPRAVPHAAHRRRLQPARSCSSSATTRRHRVRARSCCARTRSEPTLAAGRSGPTPTRRDRDEHAARTAIEPRRAMTCVIAIDAGTTGVRAFAVDDDGRPRARSYREFPQHFPQPGWVEHDADDIWRVTVETLAEVARRAATPRARRSPRSASRTSARPWWCGTGAPARPRHRAIVWQDRRTAARCDELRAAGPRADDPARAPGSCSTRTSPRSKLAWLLHDGRRRAPTPTSCSAPSTRGSSGTSPAAPTAACTRPIRRTRAARCSTTSARASGRTSCADLFDVPHGVPARGRAVERALRHDRAPNARPGSTVPVSGIAGDQQAALFGQACVEPGMTKNTYGTGSFVLTNIGPNAARAGRRPAHHDRVVARLERRVTYAMEGAIFVTGAAVQWLRDGLGIIAEAAETGPLAASVPDTGGVYVVPAFTGLGSPWWDPYARGTIVGITRGTDRAHLARAVVESMAFQTADVVDAITDASGTAPAEMRVDGGASVMDLLCQFQADLLGVPVRRAAVQETTALGAAFLAGLAEGVWDSPATVNAHVAGRRVVHARDGRRRRATRAWPPGTAPSNAPATGRRRRVAAYEAAVSGVRMSSNDATRATLGRDVLGLLGRVRVDVLVAGELADLVHHLVGELAQREVSCSRSP